MKEEDINSIEDYLINLENRIKEIAINAEKLNSDVEAMKYREKEVRKATNSYTQRIEEHIDKVVNKLEINEDKIEQHINKSRDRYEKEFETLKQELTNEIRTLLPEAGAAGLSNSYRISKSRYEDKLAASLYYGMFLIPLITTVVWYWNIEISSISFEFIFFKLPIIIPLGTISIMGWRSISLNRRLFEEYNHKQRVMELYHSFSKEIEKHGSDKEQNALLLIMLATVHHMPSIAIQEQDKNETSLLHKILDNITSIFKHGTSKKALST